MRWMFALGFCLLSSLGVAAQVNIYVLYDDARLQKKIKQFNKFLDDNGIFEKYTIQPFLKHHPLHTTLYLTEYKPEKLSKVIDSLQSISDKWSQFDVKTASIYMTKGNYLMMDVAHKPQSNGRNPTIQEYSDKAVMTLYRMRDTTAPIPVWAKKIPSKLAAYRRYGSPNVFFELSPHFTLMAKNFDNPQAEAAFQADMEKLINEYDQHHPNQAITLRATHIGIGYVNKFGQITEELNRFPLKQRGAVGQKRRLG